ncbi:Ger(x)C family spore germination protein [Priestia abyssalis]|uniref:Ger(x)C family spore germination protein n=1 Tax=Priestia abyssalis TaxID=1221450 RepID=UPI00099538AB|nr:Ger(x)C family spore germination protein [Priestia abyssalis]
MKRKIIIVLVVLLVFLTGCWNRRELNTLAIAVGMGIDKVDGQYVVSFQVVNPGEVASKAGGGEGATAVMFKEKGDTIFEALRKVTTISPRKIYVAHLRMVVIGEEAAKEGIGEILDFLSRDHELRTDFYLAVASDTKAENVLKILLPLEKIPSNKLFTALEVSEKVWAPTVSVTLDEFIANLIGEGINPALTGVKVIGSQEAGEKRTNMQEIDPEAQLQYEDIAVFKKDQLVGWLNEDESKGYTNIVDKLDSTVIQVPCSEGGKVGIEIMRATSKIKGRVKNGEAKVEVNIEAIGSVGDVECKSLDLMKSNTLKQLEKKTEKVMKEHSEAAIKKAKELETDIFGFGQAIYREDPAYWKKVKKNWNEVFVDIPAEVNIKVKIEGIGTVGNSVLREMKE